MDVSVIRIGPCGEVPTRRIEVNPNGGILARFGVALDLNGPASELVHDHAPLQALSRILNAPPESNLVLDIDLKYVPAIVNPCPSVRTSHVQFFLCSLFHGAGSGSIWHRATYSYSAQHRLAPPESPTSGGPITRGLL